MKVLITGAGGQLGRSLQDCAPVKVKDQYTIIVPAERNLLDITNRKQLHDQLDILRPEVIINSAAYTAVDKAEIEKKEAWVVNAQSIEHLVDWCSANDCTLIYVSTDFVFDGTQSVAYKPSDCPKPLNEYGRTKLAGELAVRLSERRHYIVRTGWLYSEYGNNFVKTILRLAQTKATLGIVADQIGTPTYAANLAQMIWLLIEKQPEDAVWHFSDAGVASWYDFAHAIVDEAFTIGLLTKNIHVKPITTHDYPTPAKRPPFSVLDKESSWGELSAEPIHWRVALRTMLRRLAEERKV